MLSSGIGVSSETHALAQLAGGGVLMRSSGVHGAIASPRLLARGPLAQAIVQLNAGGAHQAYASWATVPLTMAFGGVDSAPGARMGAWFGARTASRPVSLKRRFARTGESAKPLVTPV